MSNNHNERNVNTMRMNLIRVVAGATIAAASIGLYAGAASAAAPGTPPVAPATMTPPSGTATSTFSLLPPPASKCPGDAATNGYRLQSYIAPAAVDPATLTYDANGPTAAGSFPLYDVATSPFVNAVSLGIGDGIISGIPQFSLGVFDGQGLLPAGDYNVGFACSLAGATVTYWSTKITLSAALAYSPAGPPPDVPEVPLNVLLPLSSAAILGGGFLVARRRHRHSMA